MIVFLQIVSWSALAATAIAPILFAVGQLSLPYTKSLMLLAAIAWFSTAPFWMGKPKVEEELVI
jgi:hypothetical protein